MDWISVREIDENLENYKLKRNTHDVFKKERYQVRLKLFCLTFQLNIMWNQVENMKIYLVYTMRQYITFKLVISDGCYILLTLDMWPFKRGFQCQYSWNYFLLQDLMSDRIFRYTGPFLCSHCSPLELLSLTNVNKRSSFVPLCLHLWIQQ